MKIRNIFTWPRRRSQTQETTVATQPDWKRYAELNQHRTAKGYEPIPAEEFTQAWYEMQNPKKPRKWTHAEITALQNNLYRLGREPLSAAEVLDMEGVSMANLNADLTAIENSYQAQIAKGESDIQRMLDLGYPTPVGARDRVVAQANIGRDQALNTARETFYQAVQAVRATHAALRHQARLNASPSIDEAKRQQMGALLSQCRNLSEIRKLHADAISAGDEGAAYYLEMNAAERLQGDAEKLIWSQMANEQRTRRAGTPLETIQADELEISQAFSELNAHARSDEAERFAKPMNLNTSEFLNAPGMANLKLADPEPVFGE